MQPNFNMIYILISIIIFAVVAQYLMTGHEIKAVKSSMLRYASNLAGRSFSDWDLKSFSQGIWEIDAKNVKVFAAVIGDVLFIVPEQNKAVIDFPCSGIETIEVFQPSVPYVMNLNVAALFANEMTRKQVGLSVFLRFVDESGRVTEMVLGQFKIGTPHQLAATLRTHSNVY